MVLTKKIKKLALVTFILYMLVLFWISVYFIFCEGANPMVY